VDHREDRVVEGAEDCRRDRELWRRQRAIEGTESRVLLYLSDRFLFTLVDYLQTFFFYNNDKSLLKSMYMSKTMSPCPCPCTKNIVPTCPQKITAGTLFSVMDTALARNFKLLARSGLVFHYLIKRRGRDISFYKIPKYQEI
jgi:hypothetical protein